MKTISQKNKGFTIAELLISLAIMAMILAAICTAFNAYATNFQQNQAIYKTTSNCRQALAKITQQLRTAIAVDPASPSTECAFLSSTGESMKYYLANSKLYLQNETGSFLLCENVNAATFTKNTAVSGGTTYVKSVQISLTLADNGISTTLPAAVVMRKNLN